MFSTFGARQPAPAPGRQISMGGASTPYAAPNVGSPAGYAPNTGGGFDNRMMQSKQQINDAAGIQPRLAVPQQPRPFAGLGGTVAQSPQMLPQAPQMSPQVPQMAPQTPQVARSIEPGMQGYAGPTPAQPQMNGMAQNIPGGLYQQSIQSAQQRAEQALGGAAPAGPSIDQLSQLITALQGGQPSGPIGSPVNGMTMAPPPANLPGNPAATNGASMQQMLAALQAQYLNKGP